MSKAAELAALIGSGQAQGDKNLLINSDMQVAQRGTSLAMAHDGTTNGYLIDRWRFTFGGSHSQLDGTYAQVADHPLTPNGKSLKWTTGTAESSYASSYYLYFVQLIEAQNLQGLQFGSSNAKAITLSFYVKSSITGTYAVNLYKPDSTTRIINKTYTISSANTWEKKTITFPADTDSGAGIVNDNGQGFYVSWHIAAGSSVKGNGSLNTWKDYAGLSDWADGQDTNAVATTAGATWQMAQCQLEIGDVATAFEHEDFGTTLRKCQRYYFRMGESSAYARYTVGQCDSANNCNGVVELPVQMRDTPTIETTGTASNYAVYEAGTVHTCTAVPSINALGSDKNIANLISYSTGNFVAGNAAELISNNNASAYIACKSEL